MRVLKMFLIYRVILISAVLEFFYRSRFVGGILNVSEKLVEIIGDLVKLGAIFSYKVLLHSLKHDLVKLVVVSLKIVDSDRLVVSAELLQSENLKKLLKGSYSPGNCYKCI